jgi:hypothetical protein
MAGETWLRTPVHHENVSNFTGLLYSAAKGNERREGEERENSRYAARPRRWLSWRYVQTALEEILSHVQERIKDMIFNAWSK